MPVAVEGAQIVAAVVGVGENLARVATLLALVAGEYPVAVNQFIWWHWHSSHSFCGERAEASHVRDVGGCEADQNGMSSQSP